jgi:hypothetical protein
MDHPSFYSKDLFAVFARFWFQFASVLMVTELSFTRFKLTILTLHLDMSLFFVFFLVSFSYYLATLSALVIDASTLNFVHSILARFDGSFTVLADFSFFLRLYHLFKY